MEFDFSKQRISGHTGCNRKFGQYELNREKFKVGGVGSTRMACLQPGAVETESAFLKALESSTRIKKSGKTLTMHVGNNTVLKFRKVVVIGPKFTTGD